MASTGDDEFSTPEQQDNHVYVVGSVDQSWKLFGLVLDGFQPKSDRNGVEIERCAELFDERQAHVQREYRVSVADIDDAAQYLYGSCEMKHSILDTISTVCAELDTSRRMIEWRLVVVE